MAHAGHGIFSGEAVAMAQTFPQVSMEPSWCPFYHVGAMVDALGAHRVMLGSDLGPNVPIMLETCRALRLGRDDEEMVLGGTAEVVFQLEP